MKDPQTIYNKNIQMSFKHIKIHSKPLAGFNSLDYERAFKILAKLNLQKDLRIEVLTEEDKKCIKLRKLTIHNKF